MHVAISGTNFCQKLCVGNWVKRRVALGINMPRVAVTKACEKSPITRMLHQTTPLQFANCLSDAQQNYETNYESMQKMETDNKNVNLENAFFSVLVSQFYLGKFYYQNIEGIHGQTQTNSDS